MRRNANGGLSHDGGPAAFRPAGGTKSGIARDASQAKVSPAVSTYRLTGTVRIDGTGQPIAGAKLYVHTTDDLFSSGSKIQRLAESGVDGRFAVDLAAGTFQSTSLSPRAAITGWQEVHDRWTLSRSGLMNR